MDRKIESNQRFDDRVENYVKYRPSYPAEVIAFLCSKLGLTSSSIIADIGSGTGISSELFLKNGNAVYGVEPNPYMRQAAERLLAHYPQFRSIEGEAAETHLSNHSVNFIVAAQAFHWLEPISTKQEFKRILKEQGYAILMWNMLATPETNPVSGEFLNKYESLLRDYAIDYHRVENRIDEVKIHDFLGSEGYGQHTFYNYQELNLEGFIGRVSSCSFVPNLGHPQYQKMCDALQALFEKYSQQGIIRIEYDTKIYFSRL